MALSAGLLVWRSGYFPKLPGVWLMVNGFAYVALCCMGFLLPKYLEVATPVAFPLLLGEVVFMLWLLIMGARVPEAA